MVLPSRYRSGSWALLAGMFLLLGWVLVSVVNLKFASGEHYPHYSTWKSEPLGARALFESCQRLEGMTVSRNLAPLNQFGSSRPDTTFLLLGIQSRDLGGLQVSGKSGILEGVRRLGAGPGEMARGTFGIPGARPDPTGPSFVGNGARR